MKTTYLPGPPNARASASDSSVTFTKSNESFRVYIRTSLVIVGLFFLVVLFLASCKPTRPAEKKSLDVAAVNLTAPAYREVAADFAVLGTVKAYNEVTVVSETSGRIVTMPTAIGQVVKAGTVLVQVDKDLREAAYLAAEAAYEKARKDADRASLLHTEGMVAQANAEAAAVAETAARAQYLTAKKELENTGITAPIDGTIADTYVTRGAELAPGTPVLLIVDTSRLKVRVALPETTAILAKKGDRVAITTDLLPGKVFGGAIESVSVRGDESHAFPTDVLLARDAASALKSGMSVRLTFAQPPRRALLIPRNAIIGSVHSAEVFVAATEPAGLVAARKSIVTGEEFGTEIEVLSGLSERDRVVTAGQSLLADGQPVRVADAGAAE